MIIVIYLVTTTKIQSKWEGVTEQKQSTLEKLADKVSKDVDKLREEFVAFRSRVSEALRMRDPLLGDESSLTLTKLGRKVAGDINAEDEAEKHLKELRTRIGSEEP